MQNKETKEKEKLQESLQTPSFKKDKKDPNNGGKNEFFRSIKPLSQTEKSVNFVNKSKFDPSSLLIKRNRAKYFLWNKRSNKSF